MVLVPGSPSKPSRPLVHKKRVFSSQTKNMSCKLDNDLSSNNPRNETTAPEQWRSGEGIGERGLPLVAQSFHRETMLRTGSVSLTLHVVSLTPVLSVVTVQSVSARLSSMTLLRGPWQGGNPLSSTTLGEFRRTWGEGWMAGTPNFLSYMTVKTGSYILSSAVSQWGQNWVSFS